MSGLSSAAKAVSSGLNAVADAVDPVKKLGTFDPVEDVSKQVDPQRKYITLAERAQMVRNILAEGVLRVRASNPHPRLRPSSALAFTLARETPRLTRSAASLRWAYSRSGTPTSRWGARRGPAVRSDTQRRGARL